MFACFTYKDRSDASSCQHLFYKSVSIIKRFNNVPFFPGYLKQEKWKSPSHQKSKISKTLSNMTFPAIFKKLF